MNSEEIKEIYANAPVSSSQFEVIALSAPWFSQKYYLQNIDTEAIDVVLETGETVTVSYAPMSIGQTSSNADLNNERSIILQEVNDIIAEEQSNFNPDIHDPKDAKVEHRGYIRYRNGDVSSLQTSVTSVTIRELTRDAENGNTSIITSSKPANESATGERATTKRVPMLRGFI
jgi:hypothetical protein